MNDIYKKNKQRSFFITGVTGLVGGYLLDALARDPDAELHALVRADSTAAARRRIALLGEYFGHPDLPDRVRVHCGCMTAPGLGLSAGSLDTLQTRITDVVHVAASISFTDVTANRQVNREGTGHLLRVLPPSVRLFHTSTAYVGGLAPAIREDQLDVGQGFRNDYERSKFETETHVRRHFSGREHLLTVFRPSIVTGEWKNGRTFQFMTVYRVLRALGAYARRHAGGTFFLRYDPDGTQNYIPVDRLTDMMMEVLQTPRFWGATYHLVNDRPIVNRDFKTLLEDRFGFKLVNHLPDEQANRLNRAVVAGNAAYLDYLGGEPMFDCEARNRLESSRPSMPFDRAYLDRLLGFCEQSAWGRRLAIRR